MATITYGLQRSIIVAWALIVASLCVSVYWLVDTRPPFKLLEYSAGYAEPGGVMVIEAKVKRDPARNCSASWTRYIIDSTQTRVELMGIQYSTASAIAAMEQASPGRLRIAVEIPETVSPGPARIMATTEYVCNPLQRLHPIDVLTVLNVTILPKKGPL